MRLFAVHDEVGTNATEANFPLPVMMASDYVEMCFYAFYAVVGGAINIAVARKLLAQYRRKTVVLHQVWLSRLACRAHDIQSYSLQYDLKAAFLLLKLHLTFANLLVLLVMCPWRFGWLWTYSWNGGDAVRFSRDRDTYSCSRIFAQLCKIANYVFMVAVDMPSYITACIAIDRARIVFKLSRAQAVRAAMNASHAARAHAIASATATTQNTLVCEQAGGNMGSVQEHCMLWVKGLLGMAWLLALAPSAMQMLLWSAFTPPGSNWQQCTTVWFIAMYEKKASCRSICLRKWTHEMIYYRLSKMNCTRYATTA